MHTFDNGSHAKRSIRKSIRAVALVGFCAVSWAAGTALIAAPVAASTCVPFGSTCPPDDFTGGTAGTLLASESGAFSYPSEFSGTYEAAVYEESGGTLDFYIQAAMDSTSANGLTQLNVQGFENAAADMGYRSDGSAFSSGVFVDGSQIPSAVVRGTTGGTVAWDFAGPSAVNTLPPGDTSMVLEIKTNATAFTGGDVFFTSGGDSSFEAAFAPNVTPVSSTANPSAAHTGTTLQDSATLSASKTLDGSGSITFNLYGPGDTTCTTPIHTETVSDITSDGPWNTTTGFVAATAGTYQWVASFSGDLQNPTGSTLCGDEPVVVTQPLQTTQIASASTTCTQFSGGSASTLSSAVYSVAHSKINSVTPSGFSYWAAITSTGGTQTYSVSQFTNETSRPFVLGTGSRVLTAGCTVIAGSVSQSGGTVTVKFNGGTAGQTFYIDLKFKTSHVVGESKPAPSSTVRYLFKSGTSEPELDLVK